VRSSDHTAAGSTYRVSSVTPTPTPAQLQAAGTTVPGDFGQYLQLPADLPSLITDTAQQVAGGATSNYEKALLLQDYFTGGEFQYSETAPVKDGYDGTGMDVITQFLTAKSGYCIHFASAMAVMARSLGIPARISIGFLPGAELGSDDAGNTQYEVTSHDLHAWPELYFDGIGWTRFEPTVGRGNVPSYADPTVADVPTPINTPDPGTSAAAPPSPSTSGRPERDQPGDSGAIASTSTLSMGPWLWVAVAIVVVLLLLLLPWPLRSIQRGRRLARLRGARGSPGLAWREVLQSADDLGRRMPDTETPREVARALGDDPALARLVAAVEQESFAARGAGAPASPEAAADVVAVIRLLRSGASERERFRAAIAPRSMWAAFLKSISRMG
jgi:transglutaminase-like putative cysteine protease